MRKWPRFWALMLLAVGAFSWFSPTASRADAGAARLVCLNIGKADCMLLLYEDQAFLIDTGYAQTYPALETMLRELGVQRLNGVILTHCHDDHAGGLMPLAKSDIPVDAWYAARIYYDVKEGEHPAALAAAARGASVSWLDAGDGIPVGKTGGLTVLGPLQANTENENNNSLVLRFSSPQGSILLCGDMKEEEEAALLQAGALEKSDVIKAGHHGDNKATGLSLLRAVQPRAAVILTSTQEEPDTPAPETLRRLAAAGCPVYVSQDGKDALEVRLEGGHITVLDVSWPGVPPRQTGLSLEIDMEKDGLTIRNESDLGITLSGCQVYSSKGEDLLPLPELTLSPGAEYRIGSRATPDACDLLWDMKRVWHKKKRDMAILYDAYGRAIVRTDNGLAE